MKQFVANRSIRLVLIVLLWTGAAATSWYAGRTGLLAGNDEAAASAEQVAPVAATPVPVTPAATDSPTPEPTAAPVVVVEVTPPPTPDTVLPTPGPAPSPTPSVKPTPTPAPTPAPTPLPATPVPVAVAPPPLTKADAAVAWALAELRSPDPSWSNQLAAPWSGYCEAFVEIAYGTRHHFGSAAADYQAQAAAGRIHTDLNPPAGALVYYLNGGTGHVALSVGGGQVVTTWGYLGQRYAVRQLPVLSFSNPYLGWAYVHENW